MYHVPIVPGTVFADRWVCVYTHALMHACMCVCVTQTLNNKKISEYGMNNLKQVDSAKALGILCS